jgi:hypothetical protein
VVTKRFFHLKRGRAADCVVKAVGVVLRSEGILASHPNEVFSCMRLKKEDFVVNRNNRYPLTVNGKHETA